MAAAYYRVVSQQSFVEVATQSLLRARRLRDASEAKLDAGLVASANFLGYMIGALVVGKPVFAARPRAWLLAALAASVATTALSYANMISAIDTMSLVQARAESTPIVLDRLGIDPAPSSAVSARCCPSSRPKASTSSWSARGASTTFG